MTCAEEKLLLAAHTAHTLWAVYIYTAAFYFRGLLEYLKGPFLNSLCHNTALMIILG